MSKSLSLSDLEGSAGERERGKGKNALLDGLLALAQESDSALPPSPSSAAPPLLHENTVPSLQESAAPPLLHENTVPSLQESAAPPLLHENTVPSLSSVPSLQESNVASLQEKSSVASPLLRLPVERWSVVQLGVRVRDKKRLRAPLDQHETKMQEEEVTVKEKEEEEEEETRWVLAGNDLVWKSLLGKRVGDVVNVPLNLCLLKRYRKDPDVFVMAGSIKHVVPCSGPSMVKVSDYVEAGLVEANRLFRDGKYKECDSMCKELAMQLATFRAWFLQHKIGSLEGRCFSLSACCLLMMGFRRGAEFMIDLASKEDFSPLTQYRVAAILFSVNPTGNADRARDILAEIRYKPEVTFLCNALEAKMNTTDVDAWGKDRVEVLPRAASAQY
jgi:hypothetical protein